MKFQVGDKAIMRRIVIDLATGDHPEFLLAEGGEEVEILEIDDDPEFPISVRCSGKTWGPFRVKESEIRRISEPQPEDVPWALPRHEF